MHAGAHGNLMPNHKDNIYTKIFISTFLVPHCHSQNAHSLTAILRMPILTGPYSGRSFSCCHSHNARSHKYNANHNYLFMILYIFEYFLTRLQHVLLHVPYLFIEDENCVLLIF